MFSDYELLFLIITCGDVLLDTFSMVLTIFPHCLTLHSMALGGIWREWIIQLEDILNFATRQNFKAMSLR